MLKDKLNLRKRDRCIWSFNKNDHYSVKLGYSEQNSEVLSIAEAHPSLNPLKAKCWKVKTVPKIKNFIWKVLNGALAIPERLQTRRLNVDKQCQLCLPENETINHILFSCPFARQVWALANVHIPVSGFSEDNIYANFQYIFEVRDDIRFHEEIRMLPP